MSNGAPYLSLVTSELSSSENESANSENESAQNQQANPAAWIDSAIGLMTAQFEASLNNKSADTEKQLERKMNGPTREEIDAKFDATVARAETRYVELGAKIDRLADTIANLNSSITREIGDARNELKEVKADNKGTRTTIIITVIAATVAALSALWTTQSNLISAFQTGVSMHSEQKK
jgi:hypothetical protein